MRQHKFSKSYASVEEDLHRMVIWLENKHEVDEHNQQYDNGIKTSRMSLNKYSDLSHAEMVSKMHGRKNMK